MNIGLIILATGIVACSTLAHGQLTQSAAPEISPLLSILMAEPEESSLTREKRFTCDVFSFGARGVSGFNHAACAAKCVGQRHLGGHCDGPNCKCVKKKW